MFGGVAVDSARRDSRPAVVQVKRSCAQLKNRPAGRSASSIGPVIDGEAVKRIAEYIQIGKKEAKCVLEMDAPREGCFVGPAIFRDVDPSSRIAQEEIFGPVLSVIKARDFDQALEIANDSSFALDRRRVLPLARAYRSGAQGFSAPAISTSTAASPAPLSSASPSAVSSSPASDRKPAVRITCVSSSTRELFPKTRCATALCRRSG
jgi:acyl-CoA reductase-like NAD-dependent aldehyde dehydrogenase